MRHVVSALAVVLAVAALTALGCSDSSDDKNADENADVCYNRGVGWNEKGERDKAIAAYTEAIRLDPKHVIAYFSRGVTWGLIGERDKAIADYTEAIRLDPKYVRAYINRGVTWYEKGEYDRAIADYTEAVRLDPNNVAAYNNIGWLLATCPDAKYRNGRKAIIHATTACVLLGWKASVGFSTLAAAYAEDGQFDEAVKWQTKAIEFASEEEAEENDYRTRLDLYKSGKPFREKPQQ